MSISEVAVRYASALHDLVVEESKENNVLEELKTISEIFKKNSDVKEFIHSPLVTAVVREQVIKQALDNNGLTKNVVNFILLLAKKNRLGVLSEIIEAYQQKVDLENGVTRGSVSSVEKLAPDERKQIEAKISKVIGKQVILNYTENKDLIGGLIAQVGSYTFDDTLATHLGRLKEDLNRRTH